MSDRVVYRRTPRGEAELAASPGRLGQNLRILLGLVDGEASLVDLERRLKVDGARLRAALEKLAAEGYVELAGQELAPQLDFATFLSRPPREPSAERRREAEQQTLMSMRALRQAGYFVNIVNRPAGRIAPRSGDRHSILILDGDQAHALALARALIQAQFAVRTASRYEQIIEELNRAAPDLVLMDVVLPELVGLDVLAKLREHPVYKSVPVIVVSAQSSQDDVVAALVYGANGYISKPVQPERVVESVRTLLGLA
jgi:CheY-like chemotaxis protein